RRQIVAFLSHHGARWRSARMDHSGWSEAVLASRRLVPPAGFEPARSRLRGELLCTLLTSGNEFRHTRSRGVSGAGRPVLPRTDVSGFTMGLWRHWPPGHGRPTREWDVGVSRLTARWPGAGGCAVMRRVAAGDHDSGIVVACSCEREGA